MAKLATSTYGEALFELALEENVLKEASEEAKNISIAIAENEELIKLLNHPKIVKEKKVSLIEDIFKGKISDMLCGFLVMTVEKDRHNEIVSILNYFVKKVKEYNKIGEATVTSAIELTDKNKKDIESKLIQTTHYEKFEMTYVIDKEIIGGLVIRIGDRVVDSSVRTKLENMSKELNKLQVS